MRNPSDLMVYENRVKARGYRCIAGVDEVGRGPLAGPVVAAACVLPPSAVFLGIDDSKRLTALERARLYQEIMSFPGVQIGIGIVSELIIDQINILQASLQAMAIAIANLQEQPDYLLVDGRELPPVIIDGEAIIKGDCLSQSIMAAAVVAKEIRDALMVQYHQQWPEYGFQRHKGYATKAHVMALRKSGPCSIHRRSFAPVKAMLGLI